MADTLRLLDGYVRMYREERLAAQNVRPEYWEKRADELRQVAYLLESIEQEGFSDAERKAFEGYRPHSCNFAR